MVTVASKMKFGDSEELKVLPFIDTLDIASVRRSIDHLVNISSSVHDGLPGPDGDGRELVSGKFMSNNAIQSGLHRSGRNPKGLKEIAPNPQCDYDSDKEDLKVLGDNSGSPIIEESIFACFRDKVTGLLDPVLSASLDGKVKVAKGLFDKGYLFCCQQIPLIVKKLASAL